jgi:hypothetical protein
MDHGTIALLIPLAALGIPIAAIVMRGVQRVAQLRIEETRMRLQGGAGDPAELDALRDDVAALRQEMSEVQERLDFTERLLAQRGGGAPLPPA